MEEGRCSLSRLDRLYQEQAKLEEELSSLHMYEAAGQDVWSEIGQCEARLETLEREIEDAWDE